MDFYKFSRFLIKHYQLSTLPKNEFYPKEILVNSEVWTEVVNLYRFTSKYNYEHSITIFDIDGHQIAAPVVKGSKEKVRTSYKLSLKYVPKVRDWYEKRIFINGKLSFTFQVKKKDIPVKPKIISLFNIHSHPIRRSGEEEYYNFFSAVDINSLFSSKSFCMGLVTDKLLLACKYKDSRNELTVQEKDILPRLNSDFSSGKRLSKSLLDKLGAVFYSGEFKKKLIRIN